MDFLTIETNITRDIIPVMDIKWKSQIFKPTVTYAKSPTYRSPSARIDAFRRETIYKERTKSESSSANVSGENTPYVSGQNSPNINNEISRNTNKSGSPRVGIGDNITHAIHPSKLKHTSLELFKKDLFHMTKKELSRESSPRLEIPKLQSSPKDSSIKLDIPRAYPSSKENSPRSDMIKTKSLSKLETSKTQPSSRENSPRVNINNGREKGKSPISIPSIKTESEEEKNGENRVTRSRRNSGNRKHGLLEHSKREYTKSDGIEMTNADNGTKKIKPEMTSECEQMFKYTLQVPENEYVKNFAEWEHNLYVCEQNNAYVFFVFNVATDSNGMRKGCVFDSYGQTLFHVSKRIGVKKSLRKRYNNVRKISPTKELITDLINHEKKHTFKISSIEIGLIYQREGQTCPIEMLKNKDENISKYFRNFRFAMDIPYSQSTEIYTDIHCGTKIKYYSSVSLDFDVVRQYIGNARCIIIFKDSSEPFDLSTLHELGNVNKYFIFVEPVTDSNVLNYDSSMSGSYRLGFCLREDNGRPYSTVPPIPHNAAFKLKDLKDIILTKFLSCMLSDKSSYMHEYPRRQSLADIVSKHIVY